MEHSEFIIGFNSSIAKVEESEKYPSRLFLAGCRYLKDIGLIYNDGGGILAMFSKVMKPAFETSDAAEFVYDFFKEYIPQLGIGIEINIKKTYYWKCATCYPYQYERDIRVLNDGCLRRSCVEECSGKIVADVYRIEKVINLL